MRKKAPDGLTAIERAILARLHKGPAALSSLAHAARCKASSIKVHVSRLRRKLPAGATIPRSFFDTQTYHLEIRKPAPLHASTKDEKAKSEMPAGNGGQKAGPETLQNERRNNMLCVSEIQPDYTLCELTLRQVSHYSNLAWAIILLSSTISGVLLTRPAQRGAA